MKELQTQIQLEREKEEFEKLAGKKSKGDRGVNWMYEEGGGPAYGENAELEAAKEEEEKEAYLLGKEFVPKGQEKHVGDFAVAASMGGVLEKASTRGATIGAGENAAEARGSEAAVHLKDDNEEQVKDDDGRSEFNREFHLRHEDPMFAVHQKREMQRKDVEKKRHLMEKAGLVVKEVRRGDTQEYEKARDRDRDDEKRARKDRSRKRKKHHKHRHRRDRSSSVSSRSTISSRDRRYRKKHKKHRSHSRRDERRRDRSTSRDRSVDRHSDDDRRRESRREDRHHDKHGSEKDSRGRPHRDRRERSSSRSRNRSEEKQRHQRYERSRGNEDGSLDEFGRKRLHASDERKRDSRSYQREDRDVHRSDGNRDGRDKDSSKSDSSHGRDMQSSEDDRKRDQPPKKEGYGLIGTSLSGKGRESSVSDVPRPASLGPDANLLAAKRRDVEAERKAKLDQSRRRWDNDGRSREDKERALEEFERNARNRR